VVLVTSYFRYLVSAPKVPWLAGSRSSFVWWVVAPLSTPATALTVQMQNSYTFSLIKKPFTHLLHRLKWS
jgi:hypothetical protein